MYIFETWNDNFELKRVALRYEIKCKITDIHIACSRLLLEQFQYFCFNIFYMIKNLQGTALSFDRFYKVNVN